MFPPPNSPVILRGRRGGRAQRGVPHEAAPRRGGRAALLFAGRRPRRARGRAVVVPGRTRRRSTRYADAHGPAAERGGRADAGARRRQEEGAARPPSLPPFLPYKSDAHLSFAPHSGTNRPPPPTLPSYELDAHLSSRTNRTHISLPLRTHRTYISLFSPPSPFFPAASPHPHPSRAIPK